MGRCRGARPGPDRPAGDVRRPGRARQLLDDARRRAGRPLQRDLRGSWIEVRTRRRTRRRRGALHGDLEPGVHPGPGRRRSHHHRAAAGQERRHRFVARAGGDGAAGRRQRLRNGSVPPDARGRRAALRPEARPGSARRRLAQDHRRARAGGDVPDRRRGPTVEHRARLRPASHAAARRLPRAPTGHPARGLRRGDHERDPGVRRRVPGAPGERSVRPSGCRLGRRALRRHVAARHGLVRRREDARRGRDDLRRCGVQVARHVRVPDRAAPGDRGGRGAVRRYRPVRGPARGAARPCAFGRQEGRYRSGGRSGSADRVRRVPGTRGGIAGAPPLGRGQRRAGCGGGGRAGSDLPRAYAVLRRGRWSGR